MSVADQPHNSVGVPPPIPPIDRSLPGDRFLNVLALCAAIAVVTCAFLMEVRDDGRVFFRATPDEVLPELCGSKVYLNVDCAGCGLTRSFIHLAAFRPMASWNVHRAGWMVAGLVLFQIPYRTIRLAKPAMRIPPWAIWLVPVIFACVLLHWVLTLFGI